MKKNKSVRWVAILICLICLNAVACKKKNRNESTPEIQIVQLPGKDTFILNTKHLNNLIVPVIFSNGDNAAGIYIYADAPNYQPVAAAGEGFTCVDDVARGVLFYITKQSFAYDTTSAKKGIWTIEVYH